jgi:hypothetical protein
MIHHLREPLRTGAFRAIYRRSGLPMQQIEDAYERWEAGVSPLPCKFGPVEQRKAFECRCPGCMQALCFTFFDMTAATFGPACARCGKTGRRIESPKGWYCDACETYILLEAP